MVMWRVFFTFTSSWGPSHHHLHHERHPSGLNSLREARCRISQSEAMREALAAGARERTAGLW